jgi:hypothetical protein
MVLFWIVIFSVIAHEPDFPLKGELDTYRNLKSTEFALTGKKVTPAIDAYWTEYFYSFGDDKDPVVYVLRNEYIIESVVKRIFEAVEYNSKGPVSGDSYIVKIVETVIGTANEGRIMYYTTPTTFENIYVYYVTSKGPKLASEDGFKHYYILETDVPLLLERLKR